MSSKYNCPCPCCGKYEFDVLGEYDICSHCGWEDDPFQSKNPDRCGANKMSLNEAREAFKNGQKVK
ncbi:hypothetical protein H4F33_20545 [Pectobacterium brasiliense]|uniref:CPCC family cysteine-rich protein n=1 Tax=Pectobacterium TaxID=122277 RepID=UPI0015DDAAEF|nr:MULTISPECIES: CPCC family cysteine-rich protein [Pectobacterium]MBA0199460.1 hypothetical protein [Pectobacterium carotovorum]MBA0219806.1 hypothetical protein [Pectobacterium brasiliense]MBN3074438.1 hypothetical protein [Pectobacterium brasiliense]MBN3171139.1 hypothetical protein [Pectobacterium brasiliense]